MSMEYAQGKREVKASSKFCKEIQALDCRIHTHEPSLNFEVAIPVYIRTLSKSRTSPDLSSPIPECFSRVPSRMRIGHIKFQGGKTKFQDKAP